jgi:hypothetical protein
MSQSGAPRLQDENLQGFWVQLPFSNNRNSSSVPASVSIYNGDMEKYCWMHNTSLDRAAPRVLTVTALPAHRPHRILTGLLRKICTALQKRTVLSLRTIILREGKKSKTS